MKRAGRPRYIAELMRRYMKAQGLTSVDVAKRLYISPETYRANMNKQTTKWKVGDLEKYCSVLNIPLTEAFDAIYKETRHG